MIQVGVVGVLCVASRVGRIAFSVKFTNVSLLMPDWDPLMSVEFLVDGLGKVVDELAFEGSW